tara:strand:+ start:862 stop:1071 length:210 start_codon:yes stop_codon:yes gene_type:complete
MTSDTKVEALVRANEVISICTIDGRLFLQIELGDLTQGKLGDMGAAINNLTQHLFPETRFDPKEMKCTT